MKKFNNKLFNISSVIIFLLILVFFNIISALFIEHYSDNFLLSRVGSSTLPSDSIVEIIIDDSTINSQGQNNANPLGLKADILEFLRVYSKPLVIGLDSNITYVSDKPEAKRFINTVSKMDNLVLGFMPKPIYRNQDKDFVNKFNEKFALSVELSSNVKQINDQYYNSIIANSKDLINASHNYGSVIVGDAYSLSDYKFTEEKKDTTYFAYHIVKIGDYYYPSLPFKMYLYLLGLSKDKESDTYEYTPIEKIILDKNDIIIPTEYGIAKVPYEPDKNGYTKTLIKYYKKLYRGDKPSDYTHNNVSASAIIDSYNALKEYNNRESAPKDLFLPTEQGGKQYIDPSLFDGKIILIGENTSGAGSTTGKTTDKNNETQGSDIKSTPISARHPGVDVQATILDNLISNDYYRQAWGWVNILILLAFIGLSYAIIMKQNFLKGLITLIIIDTLFIISVAFCAAFGFIISYTGPIISQFATGIFAYSFKFITENRNKEKIKQAMGKYLSQDIMKKVVGNIDDLKLGGKRAVVTVLFSDIRGFTSLSEKLPAEEVSKILNEYFAEMEPIISKYNGVINKFIGDAVMAIFGEPIQDVNHPVNAVKCAYEMLKKVRQLRDKWLEQGRPRFDIGVGINTGEVFIGNIGTETRMEYTVIGDTVNLASRIEGYNKVYKTNLLVSSSTYSYISDIADVIKISEVQIRGKSKKMDIYEILRIDLNKGDKK